MKDVIKYYKNKDRDMIELVGELRAENERLQTIMHEIEHNNGVSAEVVAASSDALFMNDLLTEVKRLREQLDSLREFCHKEDYDIYNWEVKNIEVIE